MTRWRELSLTESLQMLDQLFGATIIGMLLQDFGARALRDSRARRFIPQKTLDYRNDLVGVLVTNEVNTLLKTHFVQLVWHRCYQQRPGGKHLKNSHVGILREIVTSNI